VLYSSRICGIVRLARDGLERASRRIKGRYLCEFWVVGWRLGLVQDGAVGVCLDCVEEGLLFCGGGRAACEVDGEAPVM